MWNELTKHNKLKLKSDSLMTSQAIYQLTFNGDQCVATEVGKHDTGSRSVMNCSSYEDNKSKTKKLFFVAGLDDHSQLYYINKKFEIARSHSYSDQIDNGIFTST